MLKFIYLLLLTMSAAQISAQTQLSGKVMDIHQSPLEFANVLLFSSADSAFILGNVTDLKGNFTLKDFPAGNYYLTATLLGHEDYRSPDFKVDKSSSLPDFQITLEENTQSLEAVTVTAKKPLFEQQVDRTVINVQNSVTATGSTALQILERSPGIEVDRMNEQISMQGKQGTIVMINGKRMRMEGAALIQLLQNMPSDNIEKIELISTPPASFDAEGDAGIIQIMTIKKEDEGINGTATINGAYGQREKYGGSLNFNVRKKKWNIYSDFSFNRNYEATTLNISRKNFFGDQITTTDIISKRPALTDLTNGQLGIDFHATERTVVGALFAGFHRHWAMGAETVSEISDNFGAYTLNELQVDEINKGSHWMVNFNFRHSFPDESKLSFDLDYLDYYDDNPVYYFEKNSDATGKSINTSTFNSTKETPIDFKVVKLDYSKSWSDHFSTEMGIKGTLSNFTNDLSLARQIKGENIYDPRFTDASNLDEKIGAVYISTDYKFSEKLSTKAGLRYEYYDSDLKSNNQGQLFLQKFGRLFPTFYLTYQLDESNQFNFSYAERISRPAFNNLAPTFFFWGFNTVFAGNPQVKATISQQVNASFRHKGILLNINYTDQDNPLTFLPEIIEEENLIITNVENMPDAKFASASLNFPVEITKWWQSRYNFSANWQRLTPEYEGLVSVETNYSFTANITQNFTLPKNFNLELTANLRTAQEWGLARTVPNATLNLGLQKSIRDNFKISLNWNDLFNWGSFWLIKIDRPDLDIFYKWKYNAEGNIVRLSLSHQFGNSSLKKASTRQTGSEEERQRMN